MAILYLTLWLNLILNTTYPFLFDFDFDLIFKFGEFYADESNFGDDLKVELAGAALGAIVTVGLFVWALRNEKGKEKRTEKKLENERLVYLQHLVKGSEKFLDHFSKGLKKFARDFEKDKMEIPLLSRSSSHDLYRVVNNIDRAPYFHAYRNRIGGKDILSLFGLLDYFESVRIEMVDSSNKCNTLVI